MVVRLSDSVICGELFNTNNYTTHGWVGLQGFDRPLMLQLTGNPSPDLAGRRIRFEVRTSLPEPSDEQEARLAELAWQQVGPTCEMTLQCPTDARPCLHLEWLSQNGRMVIDLVDPVIEYLDIEEEEDEEDDVDWGVQDLDRDDVRDGLDDDLDELDSLFADEDDDDDDPYGLLPPDLNEHFEAEAWKTDRSIEPQGDDADDAEEDSEATLRELRLMDELIERGEGDLIRTIFDRPLRFPRPEHISDEEIEGHLKLLLAELALFGIALDMCEHYTPRQAYRLLLEEICSQQRAYPELRNTQWVQHFMTSEYCPQCEAEIEREFSETDGDRTEDDEA
ncbi:hypothetical protein [Lignipirellula cremea]|uniref:Uncharacterized protein n=1 Tax=Lignipirellula cremea TaxID=2528010 RepID=A0A518DT40_9BACT|nr:hypothetical protein [Lignipirellula cremea]QDU94968.1 hypothetical protein Pla8534_27770 [Lignipirellula cremea]